MPRGFATVWAMLCAAAMPARGAAQVTTDVPAVLPAAVVDLRTQEGAGLVGATWRYSDVKVTEADRTNDISPHAEAADYDDSAWETIAPASLESRRQDDLWQRQQALKTEIAHLRRDLDAAAGESAGARSRT